MLTTPSHLALRQPKKTVAVIGASRTRSKFGNKAVRAFQARGYHVVPINPHESEIEGLPVYASVLDVPHAIDLATFYVPPEIGAVVIVEAARKGIGEIWLNPGSESAEVLEKAHALGLSPIVACSMLGIGASPDAY